MVYISNSSPLLESDNTLRRKGKYVSDVVHLSAQLGSLVKTRPRRSNGRKWGRIGPPTPACSELSRHLHVASQGPVCLATNECEHGYASLLPCCTSSPFPCRQDSCGYSELENTSKSLRPWGWISVAEPSIWLWCARARVFQLVRCPANMFATHLPLLVHDEDVTS